MLKADLLRSALEVNIGPAVRLEGVSAFEARIILAGLATAAGRVGHEGGREKDESGQSELQKGFAHGFRSSAGRFLPVTGEDTSEHRHFRTAAIERAWRATSFLSLPGIARGSLSRRKRRCAFHGHASCRRWGSG